MARQATAVKKKNGSPGFALLNEPRS